MNFKNKKVLIFGLGLNQGGLGMAKFFLKQGAILTITDGKTEQVLAPTLQQLSIYKNITYHLGGHIEQDFVEADYIIRNPSVRPNSPYLQLAQKLKKPILMEIPLFMKLTKARVIGVTGTKGKSTTTSLTFAILKKYLGKKVHLAGNIGKSAITLLDKLTSKDTVVLELSSYQLDSFDFCKKSPHISVITNLRNDHVDWHGSLKAYHQAKFNVFKFQKANDLAILNLDDPYSQKNLKKIHSEIITVSHKKPTANLYLDDQQNIYYNQKFFLKLETKLFLSTNQNNILQAIAVAISQKVPIKTIQNVVKNFSPPPGRLEFIRSYKNIDFYNDTTATNPDSVVNNLRSLSQKYGKNVTIICGGVDKEFDYTQMTSSIVKYSQNCIMFPGTASDKISHLLDKSKYKYYNNQNSMEQAVATALAKTKIGCLVLSPGAASFNMFLNEFDRGEQFNTVVKKLK